MPNGTTTLKDYLETFIISKLEFFQTHGGTEAVAGDAVQSLLNPYESPYALLNNAAARMHEVSDQLKSQSLPGGKLAPWTIPRAAALAFEGVFETCTAFWIARGQPTTPTALKPEVVKFVQWQVKIFLALIGAH